MPCSFALFPHPRSAACALPSGLVRVTVTIRCIPLVTAAYDTRVARPPRTATLPTGGDGSQLACRVRPVLGDYRLVGKSPEGSRQPGGGLEPGPMWLRRARSEPQMPHDLRFSCAEGDRSCPPRTGDSRCPTDPARTRAHAGAASTSGQGRENDVPPSSVAMVTSLTGG
jgi:hypothetical protein